MSNVRRSLTVRAALAAAVALALVPAAVADDVNAPGRPAKEGGAAAPAAAEAEWIGDFDKAVEVAKKEGKALLVDFTGSDWCGWCIKLHKEVFATPEFVAAAPKDYVLVALDFPRAPEIKAKVPNPARNQELARKYGVQGYPTILLLSADGRVLAQTGYQAGGPTAYLAHMTEIRAAGEKENAEIDAVRKEFDAAQGDAKVAAARKALAIVEKGEGRGTSMNAIPMVRDALALDKTGELGLKESALRTLLGSGDASLIGEALSFDPKNEKGLMEAAVAAKARTLTDESMFPDYVAAAKALAESGNLKDPKLYVNALATAINICKMKLKDEESAKAIARVLREKGPKDNERLTKFLDSILGDGGAK